MRQTWQGPIIGGGRSRNVLAVVLMVFVAVALGAAVAAGRQMLLIVSACALVAAVASSATARLIVIACGAMFVFQSSDSVSSLKVLFSVLLGVTVLSTIPGLLRRHVSGKRTHLLRLMVPTVGFAFYVALHAFVSIQKGGSPAVVFRDTAPYFLFCVIPLLCVDTAASVKGSVVTTTIVLAGLLSASSFSVEFLGRRRLSQLDSDFFALPSFMLAAALVIYSFSCAVGNRPLRVLWIFSGALSLSLLFITGTRSSYLLLAILGIMWLSSSLARGTKGGSKWRRVVATFLVGVAILFSLMTLFRVDTQMLSSRLIADTLGVVNEPGYDPSLAMRLEQTRQAWSVLQENLILGAGPGIVLRTDQKAVSGGHEFTADTPLVLPAKYGILGVLILMWIIVGMSAQPIREVLTGTSSDAGVALIGFLLLYVVYLFLLGSPIEDKGSSLALWVLAARWAIEPRPAGLAPASEQAK